MLGFAGLHFWDRQKISIFCSAEGSVKIKRDGCCFFWVFLPPYPTHFGAPRFPATFQNPSFLKTLGYFLKTVSSFLILLFYPS